MRESSRATFAVASVSVMPRVSTTSTYGARPGGYTIAPSWWIPVIQPVLLATRTPAGTPAGIFSVKCWSSRMSVISRHAAAERRTGVRSRPVSHRAMNSSTRASPSAVVVLFSPRRNAGPSSTPRSTVIPSPPIAASVARMLSASASSIRMFVARFDEAAIMRRTRSRTVVLPPVMP